MCLMLNPRTNWASKSVQRRFSISAQYPYDACQTSQRSTHTEGRSESEAAGENANTRTFHVNFHTCHRNTSHISTPIARMPTYRSINIALHSQFDMENLPEYYPATSPFAPALDHPTMAPLINDSTATCSVYIPALPGSQFWIVYSVSPPVPEGHYFLFKLYVDGEHVVSWSTGSENRWMGKTMFGLFDAGNGKTVEKRVLCFSAPDKEGRVKDGSMEIRVHRASGRRRVEREMDVYGKTGHATNAGGISLVNAGRAGPELPKRFYKFALTDPVDQPFATFRYSYRTWEQLRELGLLDNEYYAESEGNDMSVIEPEDGSTNGSGSKYAEGVMRIVYSEPEDMFKATDKSISVHDWVEEAHTTTTKEGNKHTATSFDGSIDSDNNIPHREIAASGTYVPRGAPSEVLTGSPQSLRGRSRLDTHRLSMPPAMKFHAPQPSSRPLPLPQKKDLTSFTAYRPHPAYPVEEWTVRTRSPVRWFRDGVTTPPLESRRGLGISGAGLMGVISSTWKRSGSSAQATREAEVEEGERSVSY
ncbi:uncharacterized protein M421DRAFT_404251 [Didymella exigua CBS 183.55]|uniref:Uncharacterized protein n=1 Tax=Didymella exigua CBS 183.55 TaxID=1150837 RepID=A0A6A5R748_9PLEO|nr:uncharacterized protein M421DRAFT_404251 [Didymella exigua CBS 183.55]KAF1924001.1 hypothetical protein M421DRAFT_404251 [Didymella exigua CBS 183.55]